jgi:hypothetical protein
MSIIEEVKPGLFVQQTKIGWKVVYPIKEDVSKPFSFKNNVNWKRLFIGSWGRFLTLVFIILMLIFLLYAYKHDMNVCGKKYLGDFYNVLQNKCFSGCLNQCNQTTDYISGSMFLSNSSLNLSSLKNLK